MNLSLLSSGGVTSHHLRTDIADEPTSFILTVYKQCIIVTFHSESSFRSQAPENTNSRKNGKSHLPL